LPIRDDARVGFREPRQPVDDAGRVRAAVDIVADMDDAMVEVGTLRHVHRDLRVRLGEHVVHAVDVADRVEPQALRRPRPTEFHPPSSPPQHRATHGSSSPNLA